MLDGKIRTFCVVFEQKSFTKASQILCITQPAVSQQIRALEDYYQAKLFEQHGRSITATEAGVLVYRFATATLAQNQQILERVANLKKRVKIQFGATRTIGEYVLPTLLSKYLICNSAANITMIVDNTESLLTQLNRGRIAFAFIEGAFDSSLYETRLFFQDQAVAIVSPSDPWAGKTINPEELLHQQLILREPGSGSRSVFEHALYRKNLSLSSADRIMEIGNIEVIKSLVAEGLGMSVMFRSAVKKDLESGRVAEVTIKNLPIVHDYMFVTHKNSFFLEEYLRILDAFREIQDQF